MAFSETLKIAVRKRAHLRCCICRSVGVEIHHIIPQEESGSDTEENAAPLCPSCHEIYGANQTKRKFIREARDFWYEHCTAQKIQTGLTSADLGKALEPIASNIAEIKEQLFKLLSYKVNTAKISDSIPVPIERYVRSLYDEQFPEATDLFNLIFDSRAWYEREDKSYDLLDRRAFFLKLYGEATARRICLIALKSTGFNPKDFTEEGFNNLLNFVHVEVTLITLHKKFSHINEIAVECFLSSDGQFSWNLTEDSREKLTEMSQLYKPTSIK